MKKNKAVGTDLTSTELLQGVMSVSGGPEEMLEWFNDILRSQRMPAKWNEPLLVLLPKVAAPKKAKEVRPIALGSAVCKLFSKMLLNRILPKVAPRTHAQCSGQHRQTGDYLYTLWRLCDLCREWGSPLAIFKMDLAKAFDTLNQASLLKQLEHILGPGAELECWRALTTNVEAVLQSPWGTSRIPMRKGIKQGAPESPAFFAHVAEMALATTIERAHWRERDRVFQYMDAEEMLYMDDGLVWSKDCPQVQQRIDEFASTLQTFGLRLNPDKCQLYCTSSVPGEHQVLVSDQVVRASESLLVMGHSFSVSISMYDFIAPLATRARAKFWECRSIFRSHAPMRDRARSMQKVVGATALWSIACFPPDKAAMSLLNSTQLQLMTWLLKFAKRADETWDTFRQRSFRGARAALHSAGLERWSTLWLRRYWRFAGHRVRGMLSQVPVISSVYEDFRTHSWWVREQELNRHRPKRDQRRHCRHYPRLSLLEQSMDAVAGHPWRLAAHDRAKWKHLEDSWVTKMDLPWSSGRQLSLKDR